MVGLSAVLDGDVGEAVGETGTEILVGEVVEGDGVAAGVGPDDADGGGAGLDRGSELELGEGDVGLEAGVAVVGWVDAFASGQEGQPVGGVCCGFLAAVLAPGVGQEGFFVIKPGVEIGDGAALGAEGVGKDVDMIIGNGYTAGHAEITLQVLREHEGLRKLFNEMYA